MSFDELLDKMALIVISAMKGHKTDFYVHDIDDLCKTKGSEKPVHFVWIVRKGGTHLYRDNQQENIDNTLTSCAGSIVGVYDIWYCGYSWVFKEREEF